jgi:alpha-N-arabinofuranosidase
VKVVNAEAKIGLARLVLDGAGLRGSGRRIVLSSADLQAENSLDAPANVAPVESTVALDGSEVRLDLPPQSLTVIRLPRRR